MTFKEYVQSVIANKEARMTELKDKMKTSESVEEVRSLGASIESLGEEIRQAKEQLTQIENEERNNPQAEQQFKPFAAFAQNPLGGAGEERSDDPYATLEYRMAFKNYVQKGTPIPAELRAGGDPGTTVLADLGMIIPTTIMNEFIKDVSKVYGQVYSKVRKMNIKGGVKFPISKLKANFKWITETTVSEKQKAGEINEFIMFEYNIGEIRVAETLLAQVISLPMFESEIVRIMVEAYVETMDKVIISGTGVGQPLGITKDPRVTNVVEMTETEFADWTAWRKNLFSKIPLSKRGQGEFLFTAATVEANLLTIKDKNDRPLFREATDLNVGALAGSFFGRSVTLVEPDVIADFDTAAAGDVVGIYWIPNDYGINTNMEFGMKRYFDEDTNEWINKGLTIVDGKMIDTSGCYLIKKKDAASGASAQTASAKAATAPKTVTPTATK